IEDLVQSGKSILLLGRPGVGKTTMLREVARVLADDMQKRVVIVDTSNEIAGDGDIPHPAIGRARRMQVRTPALQHAVMIEAVENHMPEVIVIDEIGTELEALAARTIAERGVQLVGTAHGNTLENLVMNPTLADLIGGIQSVTLGDEEARRRGTQKSILERKAPPTFHMVVEIQSWERVAIHPDVAQVVDSLLRGQNISPEIRWLDEEGNIQIERTAAVRGFGQPVERVEREPHGSSAKIYPFGVSRDRLNEAIRRLQLPMQVVDDLRLADVLITVRNYYRRKPQALRDAEARGVPIYVLKSNTAIQTELCLTDIARAGTRENPVQDAMQEAEEAIDKVMQGHSAVELQPQNAYIRRLQHLMASRYNLPTESYGKEPFRRVRILRSDHDEEDE
ncbi:MAG: AAA family ATPase, partial [Chloroflexi bacterium]|nr:AAA family ATPase [Chloroflexota bacterium]